MQEQPILQTWMPAFERVKKSANRLNPGRSVKAGTYAKVLFQRLKWIPAFAGMTLRSLAEGCNFDFFTRSFAGMTLVPRRYVLDSGAPSMGLCPGFCPSYGWCILRSRINPRVFSGMTVAKHSTGSAMTGHGQ